MATVDLLEGFGCELEPGEEDDDAYVSYKIDDHLQLRLAALNLTKEHETLYRPVAEAAAQTSYFGRTYSLSLRLRY